MTQIPINLQEWQKLSPDPGTALECRGLGQVATDRRLAENLTKTGQVRIVELARGLELRATSYVGHFRLGEFDITIHPKLPDAPLLSLFRYTYGLRDLKLYEALDHSVNRLSLQDLLIQQLAAEAREILARGVHRDYVRTHEDLANPRGRIDFKRFIHDSHGAGAALPCMHYPRLENNILNQALLGGLEHAARLTTNTDLKMHLNRLIQMLRLAVTPMRFDLAALKGAWSAVDRRTTIYEPSLRILEILLQAKGSDFQDSQEQVTLPGFLFDMNRFFQSLLSRFLRENLADVELRDEYQLKTMYSYAPGQNPRNWRVPKPRPDFVLLRNGRMLAILDAKYRDLWENRLPPSMLYQLSLYALGQPGQDRAASILFPTINPYATDQVIQLKGPLRGDVQAKISLRPVDLIELERLIGLGRSGIHQRAQMAELLAFGK